MAGRDYSEYEKRRAQDHEDGWRFAGTLVNLPDRHCHYRVCRRHQACCGPMLASEHQLGIVRAQKEIGLSGTACAKLPMCMAHATADHYAYLSRVRQRLTDLRNADLKDCAPLEFLSLVQETVRQLPPGRSALLTSLSRQPTSEPNTKDDEDD